MKIKEDKIKFDANFENGSMDRMVRMGPDWYHLMLRPDSWHFFHFRVRGCRGREIIFEWSNQEIVAYDERPAKGTIRPVPLKLWVPVVSYDGKTWQRVDHAEVDPRFPRNYRLVHKFTENEAYLCYGHPYTHRDLLAWLETIKKNPSVKLESIGRSRNGMEQPLLTITGNNSSRDMVVLLAREDSNETLGSWGIEGVVRRLLAAESKEVRQRYIFKIVPMVGVDGVIAGAMHSAGYGYGGGRWQEEPAPAEIENVKRAIKKWVSQGYRLKLAGKLHGWDALCDRDRHDHQDIGASNPAIRDMLMRYTDEFWYATPTELQIRPRGLFERFILDEFASGNTFFTHIQGATPEGARRCGEGLMKNIGMWLLKTSGKR